MKPKGHFETVSDIHRESQAGLDSIKKNDFHGALETWEKQKTKNDGLVVYIPKETIFKMAPKLE
jgi:hypothetical protein